MRQFLILTLAVFVLPLLGCGGTGGHPPEGYSINDGWITRPDGLKFKEDIVGTGPKTYYGSKVTVRYTGTLENGTVFDTTEKPGRDPFTFTIGRGEVITGWDEGLMNVATGSWIQLIIPPKLGYGDKAQGSIPANSTLYFNVEIISVE